MSSSHTYYVHDSRKCTIYTNDIEFALRIFFGENSSLLKYILNAVLHNECECFFGVGPLSRGMVGPPGLTITGSKFSTLLGRGWLCPETAYKATLRYVPTDKSNTFSELHDVDEELLE